MKLDYDKLSKWANRLPNVNFVPGCAHDEIDNYILNAKAILLTSQGEGWPNVLLEAASYGRSILSINDVADGIIAEHQIGFVAGNLENTIDIINITPDAEWMRLGDNAFKFVRGNYSNSTLKERIKSIFMSLT